MRRLGVPLLVCLLGVPAFAATPYVPTFQAALVQTIESGQVAQYVHGWINENVWTKQERRSSGEYEFEYTAWKQVAGSGGWQLIQLPEYVPSYGGQMAGLVNVDRLEDFQMTIPWPADATQVFLFITTRWFADTNPQHDVMRSDWAYLGFVNSNTVKLP